MEAPLPFIFNSLKHHSGSIQKYINLARTRSYNNSIIAADLLKIGNSMIDIYHGALSINEITAEIKSYLLSIESFEASPYLAFVTGNSKNFRTLSLRDGSNWTLIKGNDLQRYIHIHPSRSSMHTIRARAIALKTAIYIMIFYEMELRDTNPVELINKVRLHQMNESPIKNDVYTRGVRRVLEILRNL